MFREEPLFVFRYRRGFFSIEIVMDGYSVPFGTEAPFLPGFVIYRYRLGPKPGDPRSYLDIVLIEQLTDKIIVRMGQYEREGFSVNPQFRVENSENRVAGLLKPFRQCHVVYMPQSIRIPETWRYLYT